jgi:hypothetical protein
MPVEIVVAIIGAVALITATLIKRERSKGVDTSSGSAGVVIGQPREGAILEMPLSAPRPNRLPISGRVVGVLPEVLRRGGLQVEVVIRTDAMYPQGKAAVTADGHWLLPEARFGGDRHEITAILIDSAGRELATAHSHAFVRRV